MTAQAVAQPTRRPGLGLKLLAGYVDGLLVGKAGLRITTPDGTSVDCGAGAPAFEIELKDKAIVWEILANPTLAFGEAYMNERIAIKGGDVFEFLDLVVTAMRSRGVGKRGWREVVRRRLRFLLQFNNKPRARHNIEYHYDDKKDIWGMFLDEYRQYTCGYFPPGVNSIDEAQLRKMDHIAKKLCLKPGHRVLDIGSGWGGLAVHMAKKYGVTVEGITLSQDQLEFARAYAAENGVADRVSFRIQDYRALDQTYDRIVAVGMMEHVGTDFYGTYFKTIFRSLKEHGVALVHAIGRPCAPGANEPFINKYIFPGSHAASLSEAAAPIEKSGLFLTDVEVWRNHYAHTLRAWREKFYENWKVAEEKYGKTFCRMWEYYLASCEVAFKRGMLQVFQFQLSKQFEDVPYTRNYLYDTAR